MEDSELKPYGRDFFNDGEEPGIPWDNFMTALQVWSFMRGEFSKPTSVRHAATEFGVKDEVVRAAVEEHIWMFLTGPDDDATKQFLCHEGD